MKRPLPALGFLLFCFVLLAGCQKEEPTATEVNLAVPELATLSVRSPGVYEETALMLPGKPLRYTILVPHGYDGTTPRPLVVALHYSGEVKPFFGRGMIDSLIKPAFESLGAIAVAPDALDGGNWTTTANEKAVLWLTRCVMKSYAVDPKKVLLTGFSMGGQGTWFLAGRHQELFKAAIPISGEPTGVPVSWSIPLYVIHSSNDEVMPLAATEKYVTDLKGRGGSVELKVVNGVGHYQTGKFARPLRETVPWLKRVWAMP